MIVMLRKLPNYYSKILMWTINCIEFVEYALSDVYIINKDTFFKLNFLKNYRK